MPLARRDWDRLGGERDHTTEDDTTTSPARRRDPTSRVRTQHRGGEGEGLLVRLGCAHPPPPRSFGGPVACVRSTCCCCQYTFLWRSHTGCAAPSLERHAARHVLQPAATGQPGQPAKRRGAPLCVRAAIVDAGCRLTRPPSLRPARPRAPQSRNRACGRAAHRGTASRVSRAASQIALAARARSLRARWAGARARARGRRRRRARGRVDFDDDLPLDAEDGPDGAPQDFDDLCSRGWGVGGGARVRLAGAAGGAGAV
jgi:hypothetical protein